MEEDTDIDEYKINEHIDELIAQFNPLVNDTSFSIHDSDSDSECESH